MRIPKNNFPLAKHSRVKTLSELARLTGVSVRTLEKWSSDGKLNADKAGRFATADVQAIVQERLKAKAEAQANKEPTQFVLMKQEYQAKRAKLEYEKARGLLIPRAEVERRETEIALVFKDALLGLSVRLAPELYGRDLIEIESALRRYAEDIINDLINANTESEQPTTE